MRTTLIATGGTIAWHDGEGRMLGASELLESAGQDVDEVVDLAAMPSWDLSMDDMVGIATRVRSAVETGAASVIVTHGTDTMEETAWLTELMLGPKLRDRAAVLFTGAMCFAGDTASDGPGNLAFAVRAARERSVISLGVHVAWRGKLHPARSVRKVDAAAAEPFESRRQFGPTSPLPEPGPVLARDVKLLKVGPVARPEIPERVAGVVLEGTGAAHIPSHYHALAERLVGAGVPVVFASRCRDVERHDNSRSSAVYAGDLTAEKAAIALMVGLGRHRDIGQLGGWWAQLLAAGRNQA
jgi:L-asparaginase